MEDEKLFPNSETNYGENFLNHLIEQYKIYVILADKVSERRIKSNTFFLTANSFLISALGIISKFQLVPELGIWWLYVASFGGVVFSITWLLLVRSYRQLNTGKYDVIKLLEKKLPSSPYTKEWDLLELGKNWKKYTKLTKIETIVPLIFACLYISLSVGVTILS